METVQIVLDKKLLRVTDHRSAPVRDGSANTCGGWQFAIWKHVTRPAIPCSRRPGGGKRLGSGGCVSSGIKRGDIQIYQFAAPEKKGPVVVLTRDSRSLSIHRYGGADHHRDSWRTFRGSSHRGRWHENALRHRPAQLRDGRREPPGKADWTAWRTKNRRSLRRVAVQSRLRRQLAKDGHRAQRICLDTWFKSHYGDKNGGK